MALPRAPTPSLLLLVLGGALLPTALSSTQHAQHVPKNVNQQADNGMPNSTPVMQSSLGTGSDDSKHSGNNAQCQICSNPSPAPGVSPPALTCTAQCPLCTECPASPACPPPCSPCPSCPRIIPPGYEHFRGLGYYRLHLVPVDWMTAKETCEREGAHLAIINSQEEANLMKKLFSRDPKIGEWIYLGFHDLYHEGKYVTLLGQSLASTGYTTWNPGQPDNHLNNENCGSMFPSGGLNDLECSRKQPFVCELPV